MRTILIVVLAISFTPVLSQSVDPLTGRAIVSIPLGSVKAYGLGIDVSLNHHGGALRVDETPGNAGMGWNVSVGGYSITREVRGLPDDINTSTRKGWLYNSNASTIQSFTPSADDNLAVCTDEVTDWNFINGFRSDDDSEPDMFYFSAPGISGKFVFGADGLPKLIPFQDLTISFASGDFTIKTNAGLTYTFNQKRTTERKAHQYVNAPSHFRRFYNQYGTDGLTYTSTWDLSSILNTASGETVTYTYDTDTQEVTPEYLKIVTQTSTDPSTVYWISSTVTFSRLTKISLMTYDVDLSWANDVIERVTISETESADSKTFDFIYKSIESTVGTPVISKPFLYRLLQQRNCVYFPPHQFTYYNVDMTAETLAIPWGTEYGQDFFGYYNGSDNNKNVPIVFFYSSETGARRLRVTSISGLTPTQTLPAPSGTNRAVNSTYIKYGALNTITYPTGGYTSFTYAANSYWDSSTSTEIAGPGIRVSKIETAAGEYAFGDTSSPNTSKYHTLTKTFSYTQPDGKTSGTLTYPPVFAYIDGSDIYRSTKDLGPGSTLLYSRFTESESGAGSTVYQYYIPEIYPATSTTVPQSKVARKSGTSCSAGNMKNGLYTFPFAPVKDLDYQRGLLRKVLQYDGSGKLLSQRSLAYIDPQSSSTIKALKFEENSTPNFYYSVYEIPVNQSRLVTTEVVTTVTDNSATDSLWVTKRYFYNSANNRITEFKQTNKDGSLVRNFIKYVDDFTFAAPANETAVAIEQLKLANRGGEVVETKQTFTPIGGSVLTTGAKLNLFKFVTPFTLLKTSLTLPQGAILTSASANGNNFIYDGDYIIDATYDYEGALPANQVDISTIPSSTHYSLSTGLPIATFVNCRAETAAFDDFEAGSKSHGLSGGSSSTNSRTGQKSVLLSSSSLKLTSGSITKGENKYRYGFWAFYSSGQPNITVAAKNGATVRSTITQQYTNTNEWQHFEGTLDVTSATSPFTIEVSISSGVSMIIDDFVTLPVSARFSSTTVLPLTGPTSASDDRGNSTVTGYDNLGRQSTVYDRNRNLVSYTEYNSRIAATQELKAQFTSNALSYSKGATNTFTASANDCIPGATYSWKFTGQFESQSTASGQVVTKAFSNIGEHTIELTVSKTGYTTKTYTEQICVSGSASIIVNVGMGGGGSTVHRCDPEEDGNRWYYLNSITIDGSSISIPDDIELDWDVRDNFNSPISYTEGPEPGSISVDWPNKGYQVYCTVSFVLESNDCGSIEVAAQGQRSLSYDNPETCP